MPVLPELPKRPVDRITSFVRSMDAAANSSGVASLLVGATAILLAIVGIELQYVVGAFLICYAQRISQKRVSPTVLHVPEPPKQKSYREILSPTKPLGPSDEATA